MAAVRLSTIVGVDFEDLRGVGDSDSSTMLPAGVACRISVGELVGDKDGNEVNDLSEGVEVIEEP